MARRKRKPLTPLQQEYRHQVTRIKRAIKREQAKGMDIDISLFIKKKDAIRRADVERLSRITPAELRKKGRVLETSFIQELEDVRKNIAGLEKLMAKTDTTSPMYNTYYTMWEQGRARLDELQKFSLENPTADTTALKSVDIAMGILKSEIDELDNIQLSNYLYDSLQTEIDTYGQEAVIGNILALDSDFVETTRAVMKYGTQERQARQIVRLVNAITGTSMSAEEIRELSDLIERTTPFD